MAADRWLHALAADHPQAAALIRHSLGRRGSRRLAALSVAYATQPPAYFDDMASQLEAVQRAAGQDLAACLRDLDAFNALTPEVENDAWYDRPAAFTSMHLDTLLLGFGRRRLLALLRQVQAASSGEASVLEVGSGSGWLADRLLAEHPRWRVTLADRSAAATRFAEEFLRVRGHGDRTALHRASVEQLPFGDRQFDIVIAAEVLEHSGDLAAAVSELRRVLRPRGLLAISLPIALDIAMHPTVFADVAGMLRYFERAGFASRWVEHVRPDEALDAICDVFPGFSGCINAGLSPAAPG